MAKPCLKYLFDTEVPELPEEGHKGGGGATTGMGGGAAGGFDDEYASWGNGGGGSGSGAGAGAGFPSTPDPFDLSFFSPGEKRCVESIVYQCQNMSGDQIDTCLTKAMGVNPACLINRR